MNGFLDLFRDDFLSGLDRLLDDPLLDLECFPLDDPLFDLEPRLLSDFHRLLPDLESLSDKLLLSELYLAPDELLSFDLDVDLLLDDLYFRDFDLLLGFEFRRQCLGLLPCFFLRFLFRLRFFSLLPQ